MPAMEKAHVRPKALRKQQAQEQILKLRRNGLSYRAIGNQTGRSERQVRRLCEAAYAEYAVARLKETASTLGEELDRMDHLIRAASAVLVSSKTSAGEKMRALAEIRRCSEAKVRWLGVGAPERVLVGMGGREELAESEVAGLSDEALTAELEALGWSRDDIAADAQDRALER